MPLHAPRSTWPAIAVVAGCLLLWGSAAAQGKLYRWTDKDGNVHYGDVPEGGNAQQVDPHALAPSDSPPPAATGASAADCQLKTTQLATYKNAATITETDAVGNQKELSAEDREKLLAQTQKFLDDHCASSGDDTTP
jgi:uncharacterized protein DUF4124